MRINSILCIIFLVCISPLCHAQKINISGQVSNNGQGIINAQVVEIDQNLRILNQTNTDDQGFFNLKVSGENTSIRVSAEGMKKYVCKIGITRKWNIILEKDSSTNVIYTYKKKIETSKLLVGHLNGRIVPQIVWIEQLSDTTYALIIPVRVYNGVEQYPKGRMLCIQNFKGHILIKTENIETAVPYEGRPKTYDPHVRTTSNYSMDNETSFTSNSNDYFCYPRFLLSKNDLEILINKNKEISIFAVDTSRGDNFWKFYTGRNFAKELQKILKKLSK
jgi:hypothetical protein